MKVTPAHDLNDFEAGLRHNLPQRIVIGKDGRMTALAGPDYAGLERFEARKKVVADMEALGLVEKIEDYTIQTPISERSKEVIEPLLSEQWFVDMKPLAQPAIDVVKQGKIRFIPDRYEGIYLYWMENIRDWCISRQLWWGHRIPVWWTEETIKPRRTRRTRGRKGAGKHRSDKRNARLLPFVLSASPLYVCPDEEEAVALLGTENCWQDEDVLDTWFSSALWPHATLGWPRDTADLALFLPDQSALHRAGDSLSLGGAHDHDRPGFHGRDSVPRRVYPCHRAGRQGRRMSKRSGNGIDPIDLIDKYGADATRFSLMQQAGKNQDIKYSEQRTDIAGNFCNKLWNASRFVLMNLDENTTGRTARPRTTQTSADRWILSRLTRHHRHRERPSRHLRHGRRHPRPVRVLLERLLRLVRGDGEAAPAQRRPGRNRPRRTCWPTCWKPPCACCTP